MLDLNTKNKIIKIIENNVNKSLRSSVSEKSNLIEDLGLNSMALIKITIEIENLCGLSLFDESDEGISLFEIQTIEDIFEFVYKLKLKAV
jgi:acyl carrier protein